jgi:hypothetical protein
MSETSGSPVTGRPCSQEALGFPKSSEPMVLPILLETHFG